MGGLEEHRGRRVKGGVVLGVGGRTEVGREELWESLRREGLHRKWGRSQ